MAWLKRLCLVVPIGLALALPAVADDVTRVYLCGRITGGGTLAVLTVTGDHYTIKSKTMASGEGQVLMHDSLVAMDVKSGPLLESYGADTLDVMGDNQLMMSGQSGLGLTCKAK